MGDQEGQRDSRHVCLYISFHPVIKIGKPTIETSSNMMLNSFARFKRSSLILAETISRFVISSEAGYQFLISHGLGEANHRIELL